MHLLNKELVKQGVKVKVITPHFQGTQTSEIMDSVFIKRFRYLPSKYEINDRSIPDEMKKSKLGKLKVFMLLSGFFFTCFFKCLKEKPDIIHGHWAFPGGYFGNIMSRIFGTKFVVSIHGGETPLLKKFDFIRRLTVNSLNRSSQVIVNSNYTMKEYEELGVNPHLMVKINPIPNFVKHSSNQDVLKKFRRSLAGDDEKIILFVGRLVERKGIEYLIKSLTKITEQKIHLIIAGGGWLFDDLKKLVKSLDVEKFVTFFGSPSDEELGKLHDVANIFIVPSIVDKNGETEGLGLVILEAMESGIPVIACSVGGITDILKNEVNGLLVPQKDPSSIAVAIKRLISNEELKNKIVTGARNTVEDFSPSNIALRHLEIFDACMKKPNE